MSVRALWICWMWMFRVQTPLHLYTRDVREMVRVCWCVFEDILTVVGGCDKHALVFVSIGLSCKFPCLPVSSKRKQRIICLHLRCQTSRIAGGLQNMEALECDVRFQHGWAGLYRSKSAHTIGGTTHPSPIFHYCTHQSVASARTLEMSDKLM